MIIVNLKGGLGNQMFQYAFGRSLSLKLNTALFIDTSELENKSLPHTHRNFELDQFAIKPRSIITKALLRFFFYYKKITGRNLLNQVIEKSTRFNADALHAVNNSYINGYWNSPKYFDTYAEIIRKDFTFSTPLNEDLIIADKIKNTCSVSIHIRRGDYITNKDANTYHGVCDIDYYKRAISLIAKHHKDAVFFIFSDDVAWVKEHFEIDMPINIVSKNDGNTGNDLQLMSLCKHAIIANSTFSWWGAWLINNPGKTIVAPLKWFTNDQINVDDLFPENWIRI